METIALCIFVILQVYNDIVKKLAMGLVEEYKNLVISRVNIDLQKISGHYQSKP